MCFLQTHDASQKTQMELTCFWRISPPCHDKKGKFDVFYCCPSEPIGSFIHQDIARPAV